eukprot:COSAG01_NODE_69511_length_261_cov_0.635802_1_plen_20_part_10
MLTSLSPYQDVHTSAPRGIV